MQVVTDRLNLRWYLVYDQTEPLPDHSSLPHIRECYGLTVFRAIALPPGVPGARTGQRLYWTMSPNH